MNELDLLTGAGFWTTRGAAELGLRSLVLSDGPVGVRGERWDESGSAVLPSPTAWAAGWDEELATALGGLLAAEARRKGVDVLLGPTVNLHRSPLAGRHFECLSEDPLLTGRIGAALVRGVQAGGVAATAKHYVANDSETNRFTVDVRVAERALREVYLAPFEALVVDGGVWLVMAAYNQVNGATMTENPLLATPLVTEWGFDGVVVSDWFATRSVAPSALAGLTLVMPGPGGPWRAGLASAVSSGAVPMSVVSDKIARLRRLSSRISDKPVPSDVDEVLRRAAAEGMVLLRNVGATLPLPSSARLALLGPNAADPAIQGGGSAGLTPSATVTPLEALRTVYDLVHVVGAYRRAGLTPIAADLHVRYLDPAGVQLRTEHRTSGRLIWTGDEIVPGTTVEVSATFRAPAAGEWRIGFAGVGTFALSLDGAPVLAETVGPEDNSFAAGFLDPPQRWVTRELGAGDSLRVRLTHLPAYELGAAKLVLGVQAPRRPDGEELAAAVEAARGAEAAVVVVGTDDREESEGRDRTTLALPGRQDDLVRAVARVNPRTVVVVNSGSPVLMPWREQVGAVLLTWFPGQEFGTALADVLTGRREPGGRLPTTWPALPEDVPVLSTQPDGDILRYAEGVHVGYRAWLRSGAVPAYPFGHGLGFTTWEYVSLSVTGGTVEVRLRNTGDRPGKEVVQAYLSKPDSSIDRPVAWLAGFAVVRAAPGETVSTRITLPERAFQHWDGGWRTEAGDFRLTVGRSVADRPLALVLSGRSPGVRPK